MAKSTAAEFAVKVQPVAYAPLENFYQSKQIADREKEREEAKAQRLAEQEKLDRYNKAKFMDDAFNMKNWTSTDPTASAEITHMIGDEYNRVSAMGKDVPIEVMMASTRPILNQIESYRQNVENVNLAHGRAIKQIGDSKSVNLEAVKTRVDREAQFDGTTRRKNEDIKAQDVRKVMFSDPKAFVNRQPDGTINHEDLYDDLEKAKQQQKNVTVTREYTMKGDTKQIEQVDLSVLQIPGQEIKWKWKPFFDANEYDPVTKRKGRMMERYEPELEFKTEDETIKDANGTLTPIKVLDNDVYEKLYARDTTKLALLEETRKRFKDDTISDTDAEGIKKMKMTALELLNNDVVGGTSVGYKNIKDAVTRPAWINPANTPEKKKDAKEELAYDTSKKSSIAKLIDYLPNYAKVGTPEFRGDQDSQYPNLYNIANYLTDGKMNSTRREARGGGSAVQSFHSVLIDKNTGDLYVRGIASDEPMLVPKEKRKSFLYKQAAVNSVNNPKHVDRMWDEVIGDDDYDYDAESLAYDARMRDNVKSFDKTGDVTVLNENFKNSVLYIDGTRVQFINVEKKGKNKYSVFYRIAGDDEPEELDSQTKADVTKIINKRKDID